jgi:hypothetical protein
MKCLSIQQPWASAIVLEGPLGKDVENRNWRFAPNHRGSLFIHASKTIDENGFLEIANISPETRRMLNDPPATGCIVGIVDLVDVVRDSNSIWFFGRLGFVFERRRKLPEILPCRGHLGIWELSVADFDCVHSWDLAHFYWRRQMDGLDAMDGSDRPEYCEMARRRIAHAAQAGKQLELIG